MLNIKGKTKDGINARKDLDEMGVRLDLQPQPHGKQTYLPPACHTLSKSKKISFCNFLRGVKVPQGYSSNIKSLVLINNCVFMCHTSAVPSTTALVCPMTTSIFSPFVHCEHFLTRLLKNCGGMLYFLSRLYNRDCIFSTFYYGYIYRGSETTLVSLIQPRLNVFFH